MKVQILSRKLITPSSPTPQNLQNLKLSSLDQLSPPFHVPCIFYYAASEEQQVHGINNAERSEKLQKSLSETLTLFNPLGGRYMKDDHMIDCNDKGAEYLEAEVNGCLSQLLNEGELKKELQNSLVPRPFQPDNNPLVIVQFNMFECGGVAIGVCVSHKVADGFTFFKFINSWAVACQIGIDKVVRCPPSFQLASFCPPKDISAIETLDFRRAGGNKTIVMKRTVFDSAAISRLKEIANADNANVSCSKLLEPQPTRVVVVTALMWMTLIKVSQAKHRRFRPSLLTLPINMRGRTNLKTPENSCGNFAGMGIARFVPDSERNVQFHDLVGFVHDAIQGSVVDYAKASNGDDLFVMLTNAKEEIRATLDKSEVDVYTISSWCGFSMYGADFGWGKPDWVSSVQTEVENVGLLLDTKDGDGIEAWVGMNEQNLPLFQQNLDTIAAFLDNMDHLTKS